MSCVLLRTIGLVADRYSKSAETCKKPQFVRFYTHTDLTEFTKGEGEGEADIDVINRLPGIYWLLIAY